MKKIELFYLHDCPHCHRAFDYVEELKVRRPEFRDIEVTRIEESEESEIAASRDYYYVPTLFVEGKKLFEGAPTIEDIERVLDYCIGNGTDDCVTGKGITCASIINN